MYQKLSVAVILLTGGATLTLLLYLSWPWGEPAIPLRASDYWGLLSLFLWVLAPYLALLVKARKSQAVPWRNMVMLIGSVIIGAGGFGLYLDAVLRYPEPLSALTFLVIPFYQWMAVFLVLLILSRWALLFKSFGTFG
jgi:hypothetical protein